MKKWYILSAIALAFIAITGAFFLWLWLSALPATFDMDKMACGRINRHYVVNGLSEAFGPSAPPLLDGSRCFKSAFSSDMIAAAQLAPDFDPKTISFSSGEDFAEAPLDALAGLYPETFENLPLSKIQVSNSLRGGRNVSVQLVRVPDGGLFVLVNDVI